MFKYGLDAYSSPIQCLDWWFIFGTIILWNIWLYEFWFCIQVNELYNSLAGYHIAFHLPVADAVFPMDVLSGSTLHGFLNGTTTGNPVLVPGKVGSALYLNGASQFVNLGIHTNNCFPNPNLCNNGVTVSAWLMALQPQHSEQTIVFDNGGILINSAGFTFRRTPDYAGKF